MRNEPTDTELAKIPRLYETEDVSVKDKIIHIHFFLGNSDWYIAEYDGDDTFFGFVCLNGWKDCAEWGYISFNVLKELKVKAPVSVYGEKVGHIPLEVDRELNWTLKKASKIALIRECQGLLLFSDKYNRLNRN
jgi:hypothetical protein